MSPRTRAGQAFEDFTGRKPSKVSRTRLPDRDVTGWEMGPMVGAAYEATRDGETKQYFHQFKKTARPKLVAGDDGKQLYIVGGKYEVTDRGIEDMPALFVVNPSPRKGRTTANRRKKPMARRARRRRTSQVAIFRANPVRRRRRRATGRRTIFARNPIRRRRRRSVATYRRNPIRRTRRRASVVRRRVYRRNPSGGTMGIGKMLVPAMGIGAGAVGSEILMGYLPIPAQFKVGIARHVTKGVVGVVFGSFVLGKLFRQKRIGNFFALGAVAIATHDALKEFIAARWAGVPGLGYGRPVGTPLGYVNPAGVTRFNGAGPRIGYARPVHSPLGGAATIMDNGGYIGESDFRA